MINDIVKDMPPPSKASIVEQMLLGTQGASILDIVSATGWQAHSCRAFLTGLRKKGREITRSKRQNGTTSYYILKANKAKRGAGKTNVKSGKEVD